jgi:hypothetical protein
LYSDQDETLFDAERPVILNGIEDFVTRPDLADRAVFLALEPIKEEQRQSEGELWTAFETERPRILGVLLDAVVNGLNRLADTRLEKLPRMADFALWATACESAFWPAGTFEAAYRTNREEAVDSVIDADPIASTIRTMMVGRSNWAGTASDLLVVLARAAGERISKSKSWPETPRALAGRLRRAVTFLRKIGIEVTFSREGQTRTRMIHVARTDAASEVTDVGIRSSAQAASCASVTSVVTSDQNVVTPLQALSDAADGLPDDQRLSTGWTARANALKNGSAAVPYVADANLSWSKTEAIPHGFQIGRSLDANLTVMILTRLTSTRGQYDRDQNRDHRIGKLRRHHGTRALLLAEANSRLRRF